MNNILLAAALALPLIGLAANVGMREAELSDAEEWVIPVTGFDPRDILRGNYIRYRYDWQVTGDPKWCEDRECRLCLTGARPDGSSIEIRDMPSEPCAEEVDWQGSDLNLYAVPARAPSRGEESRPARLDVSGIFYVPEADAKELETALQSNPMAMRVRRTSGGRLVNQDLVPMPQTDIQQETNP